MLGTTLEDKTLEQEDGSAVLPKGMEAGLTREWCGAQ